MAQYWLAKTEPDTYSWTQMTHEKTAIWDGVRNYAARNNLRSMKTGDLVLIYHSNKGKNVVGIAKVTKEYFQDPTDPSGIWSAVELRPLIELPTPVTMETIKQDPNLSDIVLVKNTRLSVQPVRDFEFFRIIELGGLTDPPDKLGLL